MSASVALPFRVGARTLWHVRRRLVRVPLALREAQAGEVPALPPLEAGADGYLVTSLPASALAPLLARNPALRGFVRQRYRRSFASLEGTYEAYLAGFSAKSRSTLKRKARKLAERCGGALDVRCYRTPDEMAQFHRLARAVSAKSYQERLLGCGLPEGPEAEARMAALAAADKARGWLLFVEGEPASYLYAPAEGETLIYAFLGYDPEHAALSPGTVLQLEAMRQLFEERRFAAFDFTEGEGQHKRLFATGSVECLDLLLLRPTFANLLAGHGLAAFDHAVEAAKAGVRLLGLESLARRVRR